MSAAADHPGGRRGRLAALRRHRGRVPDQRPEPRDRGGVHAVRDPVPAGGRRPVLRAARGEGRAGLRPAGPQPGGSRGAGADDQRAGAGDRRQDGRGAERVGRWRGVTLWAGRRGRRSNPNLAHAGPRAARRLRRARAGPDGDGRHRAAVSDLRGGARALAASRRRSRTGPKRARSAGRTSWSCGTTPPSSTSSRRPRASPASSRRWRSSPTRTSWRSGPSA